jgi:hypothetical protein
MKKSNLKKVTEMMDPASQGRNAVIQDEKAMNSKNEPFGYYSEEFFAALQLSNNLLYLARSYKKKEHGGPHFKKAAMMIKGAMDEMLKAGR